MGKKFTRNSSVEVLDTKKKSKKKKHKKSKKNAEMQEQFNQMMRLISSQAASSAMEPVWTTPQYGLPVAGGLWLEDVDSPIPTGISLSYDTHHGFGGKTLHDGNPFNMFRPKKFRKAELNMSLEHGISLDLQFEDI